MPYLFPLVLIFLACAPMPPYNQLCEAWLGESPMMLEEVWGKPSKTISMPDGGQEITYRVEYKEQDRSRRNARGQQQAQKKTPKLEKWCETTFDIHTAGFVTNYKFKGNNCLTSKGLSPKESLNNPPKPLPKPPPSLY